jgi:hypothetical protein
LFQKVQGIKIRLIAYFRAIYGESSTYLNQINEITFKTKKYEVNTSHFENNKAWIEDKRKLLSILKMAEIEFKEKKRIKDQNRFINSNKAKIVILTSLLTLTIGIILHFVNEDSSGRHLVDQTKADSIIESQKIDTNEFPIHINDGESGPDCPTLCIVNVTTNEGLDTTCWGTSVSAKIGDIVNVSIYYHNTGNIDIENVFVRMKNPSNTTIPAEGSISIWGDIISNGKTISQGEVKLSIIDKSAHLSQPLLVTNAIQKRKKDAELSNGDDIFKPNGIFLGTISPGWDNQGVLKVKFIVQPSN